MIVASGMQRTIPPIMPFLSIRDLHKSYVDPNGEHQTVIDIPAFGLESGQHVALAGRSGCGKTTLLNLIAGISTPDRGSIQFDGQELVGLSTGRRDRFRAQSIGYVFQSFYLLDGHSALENVLLGMQFGPGRDRAFATELLGALGLADRLNHRPSQLSIGQRQRVAVARALANRPKLVLADEPTGSLDPATAAEAMGLLRSLCNEHGAALLVVSHDRVTLDSFETQLDLADINLAGKGVAAASTEGNR
jgi:ABC-type lipoprotein export system ATPase subunit